MAVTHRTKPMKNYKRNLSGDFHKQYSEHHFYFTFLFVKIAKIPPKTRVIDE
jgi:hypothetical protein